MSFIPQALENPLLLPLLLVVLLPLILHLIDRRRARRVDWPALRFLIPGSRARIRRLQLKEALLIFLRSLALLFIVYALLRPVTWEERATRGAARGSRAVMLILDTSFSMAYREVADGPSSLEQAKEAALAILDELDEDGMAPGDQIAFLEGPVLDFSRARGAVRDLQLGGGPFGLLPALDRAADVLAKLTATSYEIHVLTDLQASLLPERDPARLRFVAERLRLLRSPRTLRLVDCGASDPRNRFVAALDPGPLAVSTYEPTNLQARVEVAGPFPEGRPASRQEAVKGRGEDGISVRLLADGREVDASTVLLNPVEPADVEFSHRFSAAGKTRITVQLPPDGLPQDNQRHLALNVLPHIEVLLIGTTVDGDGPGTASYVDLALTPRAPDMGAPTVVFRTEFTQGLAPAQLRNKHVVILTDALGLGTEATAALEAFVRNGGGLLVFLGEHSGSAALNEQLFRGGRGILPASILSAPILQQMAGTRGDWGPGDSHPLHVTTAHPVFSIFAIPEQGDLTKITIGRATQLGDLTAGAVVLAQAKADWPWIVENDAGRGKVIVLTTSANTDDSDFPRTPLFLPFLHRATRYLAAEAPSSRTRLVGEPLSVGLPTETTASEVVDAELFAITPRGARIPLELTLEDGTLRATFRETTTPGFYEIHTDEKTGPDVFAVNLNPRESNLARLGEASLAELRAALDLDVTRGGEGVTRPTAMTKTKREQWPIAVGLAIVMLFAELLLSRSFASGRAPWRKEVADFHFRDQHA
jgi:hypothetical protein